MAGLELAKKLLAVRIKGGGFDRLLHKVSYLVHIWQCQIGTLISH